MKYGKMKNKGAVIILIAGITLSFLLVFAVLAIDFSRMYYVRGELQNAADAGALAGAKLLAATGTTQESARLEAQKFAGLNKAAGQFVQTELNSGNDAAGDIIVGNWDASLSLKFSETRTPVNAVKVVARRTSAAPNGSVSVGSNPVGLLFPRLIPGLTNMDVVREAIAARSPRHLSAITFCIQACSPMPFPQWFDLTEQNASNPSVAWTEFNQDSSIGTQRCVNNTNACNIDSDCGTKDGKTVSSFIWQLKTPPSTCGSITTKNGVSGSLDDVECAFKSTTFDKDYKVITGGNVTSWKVIAPVLQQCPAGKEPGPYPIVQFAEVEITAIDQPQRIRINSITCIPCGEWSLLGHKAVLVK